MEVFTDWHTWQQVEPGLREHVPDTTVNAVGRAVAFAAAHHGDQRRPTGAPYLEHLLEALEVLVRGAHVTDPDILCAAVLHDVVEDTPCTLGEVSAKFGQRVAELVGWVTIPDPAPEQDKSRVKEAYLQGLRDAPHDAILVKLADRASNVQTLQNLPPARQRSYYAQTVRHIVPLAAAEPWFTAWYAAWRTEFASLAETGSGDSPPVRPASEISSQASSPTG
jgi:guanosine-3',5'-bis(diphosphate) 3'-pyrophosphohydrolase